MAITTAVYVFNIAAEPMQLTVNDGPAGGTGTINGWTTGKDPKYQLQQLKVPRVLNESDNFGNFWGPVKNTPALQRLTMRWAEGPYFARILLSKATNVDLMLFITRSDWQLVAVDDGTVVGKGEVMPEATVKALAAQAQSASGRAKK
jgi:hypothetical protein